MNESKWGDHPDIVDQFKDDSDPLVTKYSFLSRLLKPHGYHSAHIQGGASAFAGTEHYFRLSAMYDEFISVAGNEFKDQRKYEVGPWGAADIDTFAVAKQWMEEQDDEPYFLSISTIDIHHPYNPPIEKAGVQDALVNSVYSSDVGFGVLWEYFKQSKYSDNTIVIVTADHALFPTVEYMNLRGSDNGYYDYIPLSIYSPYHQEKMGTIDATHGSQLDIAPTVLELMGLDSKNAFLGLSLLSDRRMYPNLMGRVDLISRYSTNKSLAWTTGDQSTFVNYLRFVSHQNRVYPAGD